MSCKHIWDRYFDSKKSCEIHISWKIACMKCGQIQGKNEFIGIECDMD